MTETTHVKVAKYIMGANETEIILSLNQGGEAKLWDRATWKRFHKFVEQNPQVRRDEQGCYQWTFIEDLNPPPFDIGLIVLLPEKTGGSEFKINTNAKN